MKNASKKTWQVIIHAFLLLTLLAPTASGFTEPPAVCALCSTPNVSVTAQSSGSASFAWDSVEGATAYKVWYLRREDNYISSETTTGNTSITFSNLPSGTYRFYFATVCGGEMSSYIIVDDLIM